MKRYVVLDYGQKLRSAEIGAKDIPATLVTFSGLFGSKQSDVKIKDVKTGEEMTIEEFNSKCILMRYF